MKIHNHFCPICDALVGFASKLRCPDGLNEDHEVDPCSLCWEEHLQDLKEEEKGKFQEKMAATYPRIIFRPLLSLECLFSVGSDHFFARFNPIEDAPVEQKSYS